MSDDSPATVCPTLAPCSIEGETFDSVLAYVCLYRNAMVHQMKSPGLFSVQDQLLNKFCYDSITYFTVAVILFNLNMVEGAELWNKYSSDKHTWLHILATSHCDWHIDASNTK